MKCVVQMALDAMIKSFVEMLIWGIHEHVDKIVIA
jgi:hypothetical protein